MGSPLASLNPSFNKKNGLANDESQPANPLASLMSVLDANADEPSGDRPDHDTLLKLGMVVGGNGLKSDGSRGAPQATGNEPLWAMLRELLQSSQGLESEAHGAAGAHSHGVRMQAAHKLIENHQAVLYDVTHPSPRTQHGLERVSESHRHHADEALAECARRLLGRQPGLHLVTTHIDAFDPTQASVWAAVYRFMEGRIHSTPEQKPDRKPDMPNNVAAAMKSVLKEIGHQGITTARAFSAPHWAMLHKALEDTGAECDSIAEGAAGGFEQVARDEAARKLISNHVNLLKDVANPSYSLNIDGKPLTQVDLERVDTGCAIYADQALREVARRLLGQRPGLQDLEMRLDTSNAAQVATWAATTRYLHGRIQAHPDEKPGRTPDMSPAAAAAMRAVLQEVGTTPAPPLRWGGLETLVERANDFESTASGIAAAHSHGARLEAASEIIRNRRQLLRDAGSASHTATNIDGKLFTASHVVEHIDGVPAVYANQVLREVVRRLLGHRPGYKQLEERFDAADYAQATAWAQTARVFTSQHNPTATLQLSLEAAAAMADVIEEVGAMAIVGTLSATTPHWVMLQKALKTGGKMLSEADGVAAAYSHAVRESAATKLIGNHENVLKDVANPSPGMNIYGKSLTQLELKRIPVGCAYYADQVLREVARRLLGRRAGLHQLEVRLDPSNEVQVLAWTATVEYLDGRIQSHPDEKPGRTPDFSQAAAAAMKAVMHEVGDAIKVTLADSTAQWATFRRALDKAPAPLGSQAAADETAALVLFDNRESILRELTGAKKVSVQTADREFEVLRLGIGSVVHSEQALRETCRLLLGEKFGGAKRNPANERQAATWATTAMVIHQQILPTLTAEEPVAAAMCSALYRVGHLHKPKPPESSRSPAASFSGSSRSPPASVRFESTQQQSALALAAMPVVESESEARMSKSAPRFRRDDMGMMNQSHTPPHIRASGAISAPHFRPFQAKNSSLLPSVVSTPDYHYQEIFSTSNAHRPY